MSTVIDVHVCGQVLLIFFSYNKIFLHVQYIVYYSGYRYGKSVIPVSAEDEDAMKLSNDKCLSLLGFTSMDKVRFSCTCTHV